MQLFRKSPPQTEPTPAPAAPPVDPLAAAEAELLEAGALCTEAHKECLHLDEEQKSWLRAREAASQAHIKALTRHAAAKDVWSRLSNPAPVVGSGNAAPVPEVVGAVVAGGS
jgi:hypothetical protein